MTAVRCHELMVALLGDLPEHAEKDFSDRMRTELPPASLERVWRGLQVKHGEFQTWQVLRREALDGKDRFTVRLQFANGNMTGLAVFEPIGQVVGLFFSESVPAPAAATAD